MLEPPGMSAILLAGGESSRMGCDKVLLPFRGRTLIEHVIARIEPYFEEILVIVNQKEKVKNLDLRSGKVYEDSVKKIGPLGGIYTGLCQSSYTRSMVFSCDMPFIDAACIRKLRAASKESPHEMVCYQTADGRVQPFPGVYFREIRSLIRLLTDQGERSMKLFLDVADVSLIPAEECGEDSFRNLNHLEDYWAAVAAVKGSVK